MPSFDFMWILIVVGFAIVRPFTVFFHEMGHAIPILFFTRNAVTIYLGSYGDYIASRRLKLGLLTIYFTSNPFVWKTGLCIPSGGSNLSVNKQILYTISGPLASLFISIITSSFAFYLDSHFLVKFIMVIFFLSSLWDLFINIKPSYEPIELFDGAICYNDGYSLKQLIKYKKLPAKFSEGYDLYADKKYEEAAKYFSSVLLIERNDTSAYRFAISAYMQFRNYEQAKILSVNFEKTGKMNSDDLGNFGLIHAHLFNYAEAKNYFERSIKSNSRNAQSYLNLGFTYLLLNNYAESIKCFDKTIEMEKDLSYSYSNRGLAKFKNGDVKAGLVDIHYSIELDADNAYAYRSLGIYKMDEGKHEEAFKLFKKAASLDSFVHSINELMESAKKASHENSNR